jgi:hypothetical protein
MSAAPEVVPFDSIAKSVVKDGEISTAKQPVDRIQTLDDIEKLNEEAQYAIAKEISTLRATSKESFTLCIVNITLQNWPNANLYRCNPSCRFLECNI